MSQATPSKKNRLDVLLVEFGLVKSRRVAQDLIAEGSVRVKLPRSGQWQVVNKSSLILDLSASDIEVRDSQLTRFVSRGGIKLENFLQATGWRVEDCHALDVGASTGGFTDCLLQRGVKSVVAMDVGHGQLDQKIWADPRVTVFENTHVLEFDPTSLGVPSDFDLIVADVSFISAEKYLPRLRQWMGSKTRLILLVKPQFEVGPAALDSHGVVRDPEKFLAVQKSILAAGEALGLETLTWQEANPAGQDGNREFFWASRIQGSPRG